jgi:predicted thioesterase
MRAIFNLGDQKSFDLVVRAEDTASFETGIVHPVYATFALGRDAEWCCRLFVLEMKEDDEEGIGTFLSINHTSPALLGSAIKIIATVIKLERNEIICGYEVFAGERRIAYGEQGQKILKKGKLSALFAELDI